MSKLKIQVCISFEILKSSIFKEIFSFEQNLILVQFFSIKFDEIFEKKSCLDFWHSQQNFLNFKCYRFWISSISSSASEFFFRSYDSTQLFTCKSIFHWQFVPCILCSIRVIGCNLPRIRRSCNRNHWMRVWFFVKRFMFFFSPIAFFDSPWKRLKTISKSQED